MKNFSSFACVLLLSAGVSAQEPIKLRETFTANYQYRVSCRVDLTGKLTLPLEKDKTIPRVLDVVGKSAVDYDERILTLDKDQKVQKTIRLFHKMDFNRKIGDQNQQYSLRPAVKRMVVLRHNQVEVPFSPDGPLTWGEIDLVRTDVFTPALAGLLPNKAVKPGDRWQASAAALQELTDMDKVEAKSSMTCTFDSFTELARRKQARIAFRGAVYGLGEDGPGRHDLEGFFLFDLESQHLSYFSMKGRHALLDPAGKEIGKVEGNFLLTRQPIMSKELADESLRGIALEPNDDNTQLLFDHPDLGVKFIYPRRWRVAAINGRHITIDEPSGNGMLLTIEALAKMPSGEQFMKEAQNWLAKEKAPIHRSEKPRSIQATPTSLEWFGLETDLGKQRSWLDYWIIRQQLGGATIAARLSGDVAALQRDVQRIVRSLQIVKQQ